MQFVPNGCPGDYLNYQVHGNGSRPVVLLHGFAANLSVWDNFIPFFPLSKYTLHLFDIKGHGDSSKQPTSDYSAQHNAKIIANYFRDRNLNDIILIGHSFGGTIALLTALAASEVTRLVLIGAPAFPQKIPPFMQILAIPVIGPMLMKGVPARAIARAGLRRAFYRPERITNSLIERYANGYRGKGVSRALAQTVRQILPADFSGLAERYSGLSVPALLLWGEYDRVVPRWQGERLQRQLQHALLAIIPDSGHNPHEERPAETFAIIREFIVDNI